MVVAGATFVLIVAGGLVTSTDSGLSVPDWPLSYGTLTPPMVGGIAVEHSHRMIAGVVGLLIAGLATWLWRREPRAWVRRLSALALGGVIAQAVLGGLTVLLLLPPPVSVAHACLGQTVLCLTVVLAMVTSPRWPAGGVSGGAQASDGVGGGRLAVRAQVLLAGLFTQLILGAVMRHSGRLFWWHVSGALVVMVALTAALGATAAGSASRRVAVAVAIGLGLQLALGLAVVATGMHPHVTTTHVALGAALLSGAAALVAISWPARAIGGSAAAGPAVAS
jgi:cytochrome c oxidase assembly protein subunit 15